MKPIHSSSVTAGQSRSLSNVCRASYQKLTAQIERTKQAILSEFGATLFFPTLATEKAEALAAWHARQRSHRLGGAAGA